MRKEECPPSYNTAYLVRTYGAHPNLPIGKNFRYTRNVICKFN